METIFFITFTPWEQIVVNNTMCGDCRCDSVTLLNCLCFVSLCHKMTWNLKILLPQSHLALPSTRATLLSKLHVIKFYDFDGMRNENSQNEKSTEGISGNIKIIKPSPFVFDSFEDKSRSGASGMHFKSKRYLHYTN